MIQICIENHREMFWQWDKGQRVELNDVPVGTKVHFSSDATKPNALVTEAYADSNDVYADVPNILLQTAGNLSVYVFVENGDEGHTEYKKRFAVRDREKPDDYIYTEAELYTWHSLDERLTSLEEDAEKHADSMTDDETLVLLTETCIVDPVTDSTGAIYTDNNGTIFVL